MLGTIFRPKLWSRIYWGTWVPNFDKNKEKKVGNYIKLNKIWINCPSISKHILLPQLSSGRCQECQSKLWPGTSIRCFKEWPGSHIWSKFYHLCQCQQSWWSWPIILYNFGARWKCGNTGLSDEWHWESNPCPHTWQGHCSTFLKHKCSSCLSSSVGS